MKLFSENMGHLFSQKYGLTVFHVRIGTVRSTDSETLGFNERSKRTAFLQKDLISMFNAMITATPRKYGVYYGVSENEGKPWNTNDFYNDFTIDYE